MRTAAFTTEARRHGGRTENDKTAYSSVAQETCEAAFRDRRPDMEDVTARLLRYRRTSLPFPRSPCVLRVSVPPW